MSNTPEELREDLIHYVGSVLGLPIAPQTQSALQKVLSQSVSHGPGPANNNKFTLRVRNSFTMNKRNR